MIGRSPGSSTQMVMGPGPDCGEVMVTVMLSRAAGSMRMGSGAGTEGSDSGAAWTASGAVVVVDEVTGARVVVGVLVVVGAGASEGVGAATSGPAMVLDVGAGVAVSASGLGVHAVATRRSTAAMMIFRMWTAYRDHPAVRDDS